MKDKEAALSEIVSVARLASGGDAEFLRRAAKALWAAANEPADRDDAAAAQESEEALSSEPAPENDIDLQKVELTRKLAERMDAPRSFILEMAECPIEIAHPVLAKSSVLTQEDLVSLAAHQSRDHLMAIAGRWDVGPQLADALVTYGSEDVLRAVFENPNAKLDDKALMSVGKRALTSVELQPILLARDDLPVDLITMLLERILGDQRQLLLSRLVRVNPVDAAHRFQIPKKTRQSRQFIDATQLAERLARRRGIDESVLVDLATKKKQLELLLCCSKMFNVDLDLTLGVLTEKSGISLAAFCRASDLNVETFSQLFAASATNGPQSSSAMLKILDFYKRLPVPDAMEAVALWRNRLQRQQQQQLQREDIPLSA